jgi:hypothetical protein
MMGLHDVLRNIKQILAPFKSYIEASGAPMAQALPMVQAPPMVQAFPVVQTTHAKEPKFIMSEKFDGT